MRFELSSFKDFKNIITTAELILNEIKFEADNEGLRFRGFNGGKTSFISAEFNKEYFDVFDIDVPESIVVDASELMKVMKRIKNDDDVCVSIDDYGLTVKVNDKKSFKINAIDDDYDSPNLPPMDFPVSTMVDFKDFQDSITDSSLYADSFIISSSGGALVISASGVLGEYSSELLVGDELEENQSMFNGNLISPFFKLSGLADMITVNLGSQYPMILTIQSMMEDVCVKLLVAPRINEDY